MIARIFNRRHRPTKLEREVANNVRRMNLGMTQGEFNAMLERRQSERRLLNCLCFFGVACVLFAATDPIFDTLEVAIDFVRRIF